MDAANDMLRRYEQLEDTGVTPTLVLNPEKTNFYDFTIDDFTMENYNPIKPQIDLEIGI